MRELASPESPLAVPLGRYALVVLRIAGDAPTLAAPSLAATLKPQLRRAFASRGMRIPIYSFLPDRLVFLVEREDPAADAGEALVRFFRDSGAWIRTRRLPTWSPDVDVRPVSEAEFAPAVRRVLEMARIRGLANDPYDYPYVGSVGHEIWTLLGDPKPDGFGFLRESGTLGR